MESQEIKSWSQWNLQPVLLWEFTVRAPTWRTLSSNMVSEALWMEWKPSCVSWNVISITYVLEVLHKTDTKVHNETTLASDPTADLPSNTKVLSLWAAQWRHIARVSLTGSIRKKIKQRSWVCFNTYHQGSGSELSMRWISWSRNIFKVGETDILLQWRYYKSSRSHSVIEATKFKTIYVFLSPLFIPSTWTCVLLLPLPPRVSAFSCSVVLLRLFPTMFFLLSFRCFYRLKSYLHLSTSFRFCCLGFFSAWRTSIILFVVVFICGTD